MPLRIVEIAASTFELLIFAAAAVLLVAVSYVQ
jgi:hypothetical protein